MASLDETTAKRIGTLMRMLSSPYENERHVALKKMGDLLARERLTFNDIATVIENANGEIEELKYSDTDMANVANRMKERGAQEGYEKARRETTTPPEFYDEYDNPRWYEIAVFCHKNKERLRKDWDKSFVEDLPGRIAGYGEPTPKMAKQILRIFILLGGTVDPKILQKYA